MKSFFKKLAFVMALAMVVSMAAPAAANAAVALVAAHQTSKEVVTELEMEVGQEIDLCFLNAQKGWKELNRGWKVTKGEGVVTVDNNGVVKAVKNGDATIEFFMEGYESAVVTITVGEEEAYSGYAQTSPNTVDFFLTGDLSKVTKAEVKLYRVFATADGKEVEVTWPVNTAVGTAEGKLSITPFVQFADGGEYRLTFKGEAYDFTTVLPTIDEITYVDTTFGTYDGNWWYNKDNNQAFVTEEDDEVESVVDFGYRVWYYHEGSLMNVTSLFDAEDLAIEYEMITPDADSEAAESVNFDSDGTIVFADIVPVYVQVVASYETEDGDEVKLPSNGVEVIPTKKAPLAIAEVVDWAFDKVSNTQQKNFSWALKTIAAGESASYHIVLKVKDTRGNIYVTKAAANKNGNSTFPVLGDDSLLDDFGYSFRFYSTDTDDFLLGEYDGIIETYKKVDNAVFYVDLYKWDDEDSEDKKVESIFAAEFDLGAPRKFYSLYPATKTLNVVADAIDGNTALLEKSVKITALDQYNDPYEVYSPDWEVTCNDKDAKKNVDFWYSTSNDKEIFVTVNGAKLYENTGATSLSFTLKEKDTGISTTFKVNIGKPQWVDKSTETSKTNVKAGYFSDHKPEGKEQYSWDLIIDQFKKNGIGHDSITFSVDRNDPFTWLGEGEGTTYGGNWDYHREAIISLYKTSNKQTVGYHDVDEFVVLTNKNWEDTTTGVVATGNGDHTLAVGDRLIGLIRGGKITAPYYGLYALNINGGVVTIPLANHYSNEVDRISYAYSGTYDLVVYTITEVEENAKGEIVFDYEVDSIAFNVRDQRGAVTFGERTKFETEFDFDGTSADIEDLKKIVIDCFSFKLGGAAWGLNNQYDDSWELINSVTYEVKDDKVIIKTVQFNVPVDGSVDLGDGEDYYRENSTKVTINQSVKMK